MNLKNLLIPIIITIASLPNQAQANKQELTVYSHFKRTPISQPQEPKQEPDYLINMKAIMQKEYFNKLIEITYKK